MKKSHVAGPSKDESNAKMDPRPLVNFSSRDDRDLIGFSSKILFDTYDKYATFLHFIITLAGGTTLIFFNSIKFADISGYTDAYYALWAIGFSGVSLVMAIIWRACLQHFMEHECFGAEEILDSYFNKCGIQNVTKTHLEKHPRRKFHHFCYRSTQWFTLPVLIAAWVMIMLFVHSNIVPEKGSTPRPSPAATTPAAS